MTLLFSCRAQKWLILAILSVLRATATEDTTDATLYLRKSGPRPIVSSARAVTSNCNDQKDKTTCFVTQDNESHEPCQWCEAGAIPSECMSADQAKLLPSAVFDCTTPGQQKDTKPPPRVSTSNFKWSQQQYTLNAKEHQKGTFCDDSSKSISGYIDIKGSEYDKNGENKHLFFWMFERRPTKNQTSTTTDENDDSIPFVMWLTGGPGCSSTLALLTENGPCSVNDDGVSTTVNPFSWTEAAHVLWLDQPAGVGFSYGSETDTNEKMVSEDAYYFLEAFLQQYPQYANNPFYIVGESYAGHYVPAIAHRIHVKNMQLKERLAAGLQQTEAQDPLVNIPLAGIAIGNGLTNPELQYPWYPDMAFNNSHGIKVVNEDVYNTMKAVVPRCTQLIHQCNQGDNIINTFACQTAFLICNLGLTSPYQATGLSPYDISKPCEYPPLCSDMSHLQHWLNLESTKQALHVDEKHSHAWTTCNFGINLKFHTDWMKDFSGFVADLLDADLSVLIYAGDLDYICNYLGNRAWTLALPWKGHDDFVAQKEHDWRSKGLARTSTDHKFTFLQVYDAGHMVPADQPEAALDMLKTFLAGESF